MPRTALQFAVDDMSRLARFLTRHLRALGAPPGHVQMLNLLASAAGFRNYQHMRAARPDGLAAVPADAPPEGVDSELIDRAARTFEGGGVLARWPSKSSLQRLCLWALWSQLPAERSLTEREISARLDAMHAFGDAAMLRRDLVGAQLVSRTLDGRDYRRIEQEPPPEAAALIRAITRRRKRRAA